MLLRPQYGWYLKKVIFSGDGGSGGEDLILENQKLKAEIAKLENLGIRLPATSASYISAFVYSQYPFNFRNEFLIDAGSSLGVEAGDIVVVNDVFVGRVRDVFNKNSLVRTIFDVSFQSPVRIGKYGVQGLLQGGSLPEVILIPIDSKAEAHDIVYTSSPEFPYGLAVGEIGELRTSPDKLFKEADLKVSYDIGLLTAVSIVKNGK